MKASLTAEIERLCTRAERGVCLGLDRMLEACANLGHPEARFDAVHIAGTNGKGSTAAMLERIFREHGLRTGLYSSPHLGRFAERIRIDGAPVEDEEFADALARAGASSSEQPSVFEALTLAAFVVFARAEVDVAVLEVGLGGRLDATNVIPPPLACAVTSIGLDHTGFLGNDLASIAREKAAIAKPGSPLFVGPLPREAIEATRTTALERGASELTWVTLSESTPVPEGALRSKVSIADNRARVSMPDGAHYNLRPSLEGRHQLTNAAVAATVAHGLRARFPELDAAIETGVTKASWPGRLERVLVAGREVLLDCAHNAEGIATLCEHLRGRPPERTLLVFGAVDDKPWRAMLDALAGSASRRHYCIALEPTAGRASVTPEALVEHRRGRAHASPEAAITAALADAGLDDLVVVTGSIFLVGRIRSSLLATPGDPVLPM